MANQAHPAGSGTRGTPHAALKAALTLGTFAIAATVAVTTLLRTPAESMGAAHGWLILGSIAAMLLLLAMDRLVEFSVSPGGVSARLAEAKREALEEVTAQAGPEVAGAIRRPMEQASSPEAVADLRRLGLLAGELKLNVLELVDSIIAAIQARRRLRVHYRTDPDRPAEVFEVAPLDLQIGRTDATRERDYLWAFSFERRKLLSLSLGRIARVEETDRTFEPSEVDDLVGEKRRGWNIARDW